MTTETASEQIRKGSIPPYLLLPLANTILEAIRLIFSRPNRRLEARVADLERIVEQQQAAIAELAKR